MCRSIQQEMSDPVCLIPWGKCLISNLGSIGKWQPKMGMRNASWRASARSRGNLPSFKFRNLRSLPDSACVLLAQQETSLVRRNPPAHTERKFYYVAYIYIKYICFLNDSNYSWSLIQIWSTWIRLVSHLSLTSWKETTKNNFTSFNTTSGSHEERCSARPRIPNAPTKEWWPHAEFRWFFTEWFTNISLSYQYSLIFTNIH